MSISLSQTVIPLAPVGTLDDSAFTLQEPSQWIAVFAAQIAASRAVGTLCRGRVYVSEDVAARMFSSVPEVGAWNSPVLVSDGEGIKVYVDIELSENSVRIE